MAVKCIPIRPSLLRIVESKSKTTSYLFFMSIFNPYSPLAWFHLLIIYVSDTQFDYLTAALHEFISLYELGIGLSLYICSRRVYYMATILDCSCLIIKIVGRERGVCHADCNCMRSLAC